MFKNIFYLRNYFIVLICSCFTGLSAQTLKFENKLESITDSVIINKDITYYNILDTARTKEKASYIRVGTDYYRTLFSITELKALLADGKISSLGKLYKKQIPYKKEKLNITYLTKDTVNLFFLLRVDYLFVIEYYGKLENFFTQKDKVFNSNSQELCNQNCRIVYQLESFFGKPQKDGYEDRRKCETDCLIETKKNASPTYYIYKIPVKNLSVKF